jgi:hypothetical protein
LYKDIHNIPHVRHQEFKVHPLADGSKFEAKEIDGAAKRL